MAVAVLVTMRFALVISDLTLMLPMVVAVSDRVRRRSIPVPAIVNRNDTHGVRHRREAHVDEWTAPGMRAIPVAVLDEIPIRPVPIEIVVVVANVIDLRRGN